MLPKLLPMLAVPAELFDSAAYSFEVKWDGIRALAAVDETGWRLWGRERADYTAR
jgi:bifunctional non-homologous end joining protein LigD